MSYTLEQLRNTEATVTPHRSRSVVAELFQRSDLRCYSSKLYTATDALIHRFMQYHGRMRGLSANEIYAPRPSVIIKCTNQDQTCFKGGLYTNGAVLLVTHPQREDVELLFLQELVAKRWGYPEEGFLHTWKD